MLDSAPGTKQPWVYKQTGGQRLESSLAERDMGILVDSKLIVSHQFALADKRDSHTLGCIGPNTANQAREGIVLLCSVLI